MIKNTPATRITEIVTKIRESYPHLQDVIPIKIPDGSIVQGGMNINKIDIGNARDVNFQNKMIEEYLTLKYTIDKDIYDKIFEINHNLNAKTKPVEFQRNIVWKAKEFDFSNMFSYGEGNKIDFEKFKGIVGLFAPNKTGKCVEENTEIKIEFDEDEIINKLGFLPDELK